MRNISFMLTPSQLLDGSKDVTRRLGWKNLKPGQRIQACKKCMGLKKGEAIEKLAVIEIVSVNREPLSRMISDPVYGQDESRREGFPGMSGLEFVEMFCKHMKVTPDDIVTRIEFIPIWIGKNYAL